MDTRSIGFSLVGEDIPLGTFINAAQKLSDLLSELDVEVSGSKNLDWSIVDLGVGSANLAVEPTLKQEDGIDYGDMIISSALSGLKLIEQEASRPEHFTDEALKKAKELVRIINGKVERIAVFGKTESTTPQRVRVTQRIAAHVDQLIGTNSVATGSVEGVLETLTIHGGPEFAVYDVIAARRVRCICDRDTLNQLLTHLEERLSVKGEVRFNIRGEPTSVKVESFRPLGDKELPQAKDIRGLFSENKVDINEWSQYVRKG